MAYISGIFDGFFKAGLVPLNMHCSDSRATAVRDVTCLVADAPSDLAQVIVDVVSVTLISAGPVWIDPA